MLLTNLNNIDDLFDDFFFTKPYSFRSFTNSSAHKINNDDDGVTLTMNVPGYNKKLIDVSVDGDTLIVKGKANSGDTEGFTKNFSLNTDRFDADNITAGVTDGVLTISVPYLEEVKPRKIEVTVK